MTTSSSTQTTTAQAYKLQNKLVYPNSDFDYEAWIVEFPGWKETDANFWQTQPVNLYGTEGVAVREKGADGKWRLTQFNLPERIEFETFGDIIRNTDYPYCKPQWPIMSRRMLETLLSVQEFPHQVIPVTMVDIQKYFDETIGDYIAPENQFHDFVVVQLLKHLDIFDWERSIYQPEPGRNDRVESVEQLVLRIPEGGLPPLFRIEMTGLRVNLYVSPQGRAALEAIGIRGVSFLNLI
jgi:hypothetical protein